MTERNESKFARLFTRDGHLTELTVNRVVSGELSGDESAQVDEHVAGCEPCAARIEAVRAFDASFSIAPPPGLGENDDGSDEVVSLAEERETRRPTGLIVFGAVAAAAAAVLIALNTGGGPEPARVQPGDGIRTKGSSVAMTVFAKSDDGNVRQLGNGDVVHPGDRLGFEVKSTEDGYLLLAGVDSAGQVYPVYPQTDGRAEKVEGTAEKRALEAAIRLDDVGTSERLVAMRCPEGFAFDEAIDALKRQREGDEADEEDPFAECVYSEVTLKKEPK